jgi:GGDEF domain-containing protein
LRGKKLSISASIGISIYPKDSFDIDILVNKADVAMYNAKEQGGNNYKFFT